MDPIQCLKDMFEAYEEGRYEDAGEKGEAMLAWLRRDGFTPNPMELSPAQVRLLITFAANWAAGLDGCEHGRK